MAENISLRGRSRQENVEPKTPYQMAEKLDIQDVGSTSYNTGAYEDGWGDTHHDIRDMQRLGKKQEFKVIVVPSKRHPHMAKDL